MPIPLSWRGEEVIRNVDGGTLSVEEALQRLMQALENEGAAKISYDATSVDFRRGYFLSARWRWESLFYVMTGGSIRISESADGLAFAFRLDFLSSLFLLIIPLSIAAFAIAGWMRASGPGVEFVAFFAGVYALLFAWTVERFPGFIRRAVARPVSGPTQGYLQDRLP